MFLNKIKISFVFFFIFGFSISLYSQIDFKDETIAEIDGDKITASLFQELWEMSPHLNTGSKNNSLSEKINFLNTIIAYKLWYRNSTQYKIDTSAAYSTAIDEIKKMYVRDALYRKEILSKITITPTELNNALEKQEKTLVVNYLFALQEEEIKNLYNLLISGIPFDSLLTAGSEYKNQSEPVKIIFGDYPDLIEEELFSINPGAFSQPIQFSDGYYIFYLKNVIKKLWGGVDEQEKEKQKAEDIIKKRKENVLYDSFMKKTLSGIKADVNRNMFKKLESELVNAFAGKTLVEGKNSFLTLSIDEFIKLQKHFTEKELKDVFITFSWDSVSFEKCLRSLYFNGLRIPSSDPEVIKRTFDTYIRSYIEMEVLYRKGLNEGLQYSAEVQKYLKMWSEFYAFETVKSVMIDTVKISENQVRSAYNGIYRDITENIFMKFDYACFHDSFLANSAMQKIMNGFEFDSLKSQNSLKLSNSFFSDKNKWVPLSDCGDYKTKLSQLEVGSLLDIINFDSLYVLVKIMDKKNSKELMGYASYEETYSKLKKQLAWEKIKNQITKKTADYAVSLKITINYETLSKLDLTRISSVTVRFLGFGGSISGVPIYTPNYEWTELVDSKTLFP